MPGDEDPTTKPEGAYGPAGDADETTEADAGLAGGAGAAPGEAAVSPAPGVGEDEGREPEADAGDG